MAIKTYRAKTPTEALALVKKDLGDQAVILHTRTYKTGGVMGIGARSTTEITATTAATAGATPAPRTRSHKAPAKPAAGAERASTVTPSLTRSGAVERPAGRPVPEPTDFRARAAALADHLELSAAARDRGQLPQRSDSKPSAPAVEHATRELTGVKPGPGADLASGPKRVSSQGPEVTVVEPMRGTASAEPVVAPAPAAASAPVRTPDAGPSATQPDQATAERPEPGPKAAAPVSLGDEPAVRAELAELKQMMGRVLRSSAAARGIALPQTLTDLAGALEDAELDPEITEALLGTIRDELDAEELSDADVVRQTALRRLAEIVPVDRSVARADSPASGGPLVVALVGPTGVGKTTTLAKLAATYKLRHGKSVALVTSDTYRIAAVDQLRTYANIIGLPVEVTLTPAEMAQAVRALGGHDVVLVDTAGRSQNDSAKIAELRSFLDAARPHHTHLVLSSIASSAVLKRTTSVFSQLAPTHAIATKLDEAAALGPILSAVRRLDVPLSFVTTGQEVPDQIETACADRFARRLLPALRSEVPA